MIPSFLAAPILNLTFNPFRINICTKAHADLISAAALSAQVSSSHLAVLFKLEVLAPWLLVS
jgi:hypothetical protein